MDTVWAKIDFVIPDFEATGKWFGKQNCIHSSIYMTKFIPKIFWWNWLYEKILNLHLKNTLCKFKDKWHTEKIQFCNRKGPNISNIKFLIVRKTKNNNTKLNRGKKHEQTIHSIRNNNAP